MRDMVAMKHAVANLLVKLAKIIKGEDRIGEAGVRDKTRSSILSSASSESKGSPEVEAFLTAGPLWGADEAKATAAFLNSPAGRLFSTRIRSVAAHVAIEGANDRANTVHSAGVSAGWNECVRYIHSLSRVSGDQDTQQGAASHLKDRHQPEGEAELLERLSP